uniref:Uncharacterized protein n=1 Tax=Anopheles maculatus TaxID=74869 RepID=A0A182SP70_9DIPT
MSSVFSSGDGIIQNQTPAVDVDKVEFHDIWNDVQKQRCLRWIEKHNLKRIALQLPDILLHHSVEIVNQLQSESFDEFQMFVLADTSYVCYANAIAKIREKLVDRFPNMMVASLAEDNQIADILCWKLDVPLNSKATVLYIGRDNLSFFNTAVALEASQCCLYDPTKTDPQLERIDPIGAKWLRRRYYAIERCMDAGSIGIVVATLSTKGYLDIVSRVQQLAKARGVRSYLISIGKVNPEKLANFVDIDCFVLVGCPENDIFTSRDFYRPLLSVFEAEMAFNNMWKEKLLSCYTTNFTDLLPNGRLYTNVEDTSLNVEDTNVPPDVSLITGKARHTIHQRKADMVETTKNGSCTDVASKGRNELTQISSADQFINRSWQGLEQNLGQDAPAVVQMGRSGIPIKYENESNRIQ